MRLGAVALGSRTDRVIAQAQQAEAIDVPGRFTVNAGPLPIPEGLEIPVLVAALGPRLLRPPGRRPRRRRLARGAGCGVAAADQFATYGLLPNYQRILAHGGISGHAEAVIVGDEPSVTRQIKALFEAGATDVWLPPFPVGPTAQPREPAPALS